MRYLVFGDVHGNCLALDAVFADARARGVDAYFFVGDLVGYGPQPIECIDRLYALQQRGLLAWVAGNHELAMRGEVSLEGYSEEALATLRWTRQLLEKQPWALRFIEQAEPTTFVNEIIYLTHDSASAPSSGAYHRHAHDAIHELHTLRDKGGRFGFYGHTHVQRAELLEGQNILLAPVEAHTGAGLDRQPVRVGREQRAWIGTGSVGFPKNAGRTPEYLIFDDAEFTVEKYSVAYDRARAKETTREILTSACGAPVAERVAKWL